MVLEDATQASKGGNKIKVQPSYNTCKLQQRPPRYDIPNDAVMVLILNITERSLIGLMVHLPTEEQCLVLDILPNTLE